MRAGAANLFPPHDFVLSMVAERTHRDVFQLRKLIDKNPRRGIGNLIRDIGRTGLIAGRGTLFVVIDRDKIAEHLSLGENVDEQQIRDTLMQRSDAPSRLSIHFLLPNIEGLMQSIAACAAEHQAPEAKNHNERDRYLNAAAFCRNADFRRCVALRQSGLATLVDKLAALCGDLGTPGVAE